MSSYFFSETTPISSTKSFYDESEDNSPLVPTDPNFVLGSQKYEIEEAIKSSKNLGKKTITYPGSFVIIVNNISGPGMLGIPLVFQQAGWLPTIACLLMIWIVSTLSASTLLEAIATIPGNSRFSERVEFATVVRHYFGQIAYWLTQIFYNLSLETLTIASIIVTAQAMDGLLVFVIGKSWALEFYPDFDIITQLKSDELATPFCGNGKVILSAGYLICTVFCLPMGFMNLDENVWFQYASFGFLITLLGEFIVQFFVLGLHFDAVPMIGEDLSTALGTIIFSFTFVVTIPSWANEKKENVSINKIMWLSTTVSTFFYIFFGILGAYTYPNMTNGNLLDVIPYYEGTWSVTKFSVYIFSLGVIGLGIPMFSIIIRYNLHVGGVCGFKWAAFWGAVFPWAISWLLYQGNGLTIFVNWSSLFINGFINFSVPLILFCQAQRVSMALKKSKQGNPNAINDVTTGENEYLSKETESLLLSLHRQKDELTGWVRHFAYPGIEKNDQVTFAVTLFVFELITALILVSIGIDLYYLIFEQTDILATTSSCVIAYY